MSKDISAQDWANALESGEYDQGGDYMYVENYDEHMEPTGEYSYCCLGVLCAEYVDPQEWRNNFWFEDGTESAELPEYVLQHSPFMRGDAKRLAQGAAEKVVVDGTIAETFAFMNDAGVGFKAIASIIREWEQMDFDADWLSGRAQGEVDRVRKYGRDY